MYRVLALASLTVFLACSLGCAKNLPISDDEATAIWTLCAERAQGIKQIALFKEQGVAKADVLTAAPSWRFWIEGIYAGPSAPGDPDMLFYLVNSACVSKKFGKK